MIPRYCAKTAVNSIIKCKRFRLKTSRYLNGFASNHCAARELGYATWPIGAIPQSIIKQQTTHKSLTRGNALDASEILPGVSHDKLGKRFYISDKDGRGVAFLKYEVEKDLMRIMHTEVPKEIGGRGYGKMLAEEALVYATENNYRVRIVCKFVRTYIEKYAPKYSHFLKKRTSKS